VEVAEERAKGLAEVAEERDRGLAEINARRAELHREVATMQMYQAAHEGHVKLNIGGFRFETSVQTLRRAYRTPFSTLILVAGTRRTCALTAAFSWIGTASTSGIYTRIHA
jgi:hypothetical protein